MRHWGQGDTHRARKGAHASERTEVKQYECADASYPSGRAQDVRGFPARGPVLQAGCTNTGSERRLRDGTATQRPWGQAKPRLLGTTCRSIWAKGNVDMGQKAEGTEWARTRTLLSFVVERGECEQIRQNKVPNPKSQRLSQVQVLGQKTTLANHDSGSPRNATLIHLCQARLVTQGSSGPMHSSK